MIGMSQEQVSPNRYSRVMLINQIKKKMLNFDEVGRDKIQYFLNSIKKAVVLKNYSNGTEIVFLVFDLDRLNSLKRLFCWVELWERKGVWGNPKVQFFLVGTK